HHGYCECAVHQTPASRLASLLCHLGYSQSLLLVRKLLRWHRPAVGALRARRRHLLRVPPRGLPDRIPLDHNIPSPVPLLCHPAAVAGQSAALRLPRLRFGRRSRQTVPLPPRALPPSEPLHPPLGRGGVRLGANGAGGLRGHAPGSCSRGQRACAGEGQPPRGHHHGNHHAACRRHLPVRPDADWDWFINLSASDYPLITQDDLMDMLSRLPRDLNFIDHRSDMGRKASARAMGGIVDPGLLMNETEKQELPTAFTLFTGSAWTVLSRPFVEYLIRGWKNLPRNLLVSSPEAYFHTMACNAEEFRNTTVNHDMHYISWGGSPARQPELINSSHWDGMLGSDAPFACNFGQDNPVLDRIDAELLSRQPGMLAPGSWSIGDTGGDGSFWIVRDASPLRPGPGAARLQRLVTSLLSEDNFRPKQCKIVCGHGHQGLLPAVSTAVGSLSG
uniref:Protein xylosyltransferase n=1 Tax=Aegilops tauschii subsp. strangulata TaxID=200361 RepID=A0A453TBR1_AEGTS